MSCNNNWLNCGHKGVQCTTGGSRKIPTHPNKICFLFWGTPLILTLSRNIEKKSLLGRARRSHGLKSDSLCRRCSRAGPPPTGWPPPSRDLFFSRNENVTQTRDMKSALSAHNPASPCARVKGNVSTPFFLEPCMAVYHGEGVVFPQFVYWTTHERKLKCWRLSS